MKTVPYVLVTVLAAAAGFFLVFDYFRPAKIVVNAPLPGVESQAAGKPSPEERIRKAEERSSGVKGVYMTSTVANDSGRAAAGLRAGILTLLDATELNAVVIDVKETAGGLILTGRLKDLINELHQKDTWVIARQVVFKDSSQEKIHPEWYLKRASGAIWRDRRGGSWLDPASAEVWDYQLSAAKAASDAGFDEIQFDYIRFPSDGDVANIVYPIYKEGQPKYEVLREFFAYLGKGLKRFRPELILSADLFGYVALERADLGIGQRLEDIGENFDYISLMVYPSHYYSGFQAPADPERRLTGLYFPYRSRDISEAAASHPYEVVNRSLIIARNMLDRGLATTSPNFSGANPVSAPSTLEKKSKVKLRPWLQDFDLGVDSSRGIIYDAKKVRAQIDAAEAAPVSGWLLWSANNVYTKEALKPK